MEPSGSRLAPNPSGCLFFLYLVRISIYYLVLITPDTKSNAINLGGKMQATVYNAKELVVNTASVPRERMGEVIRSAQDTEGQATRIVFSSPGELRDGAETADAFEGDFFWESFVGVTVGVPAEKWEMTFEAIKADAPRKEGERLARYEQRLRKETDAEFRAEYRLANPKARSHRIRVVTTEEVKEEAA